MKKKNSSVFYERVHSFDPDQTRLYVRHDLDPNNSQKFSAEDTSRQRVKCVISGWQIIMLDISCEYSILTHNIDLVKNYILQ